MTTSMYSASKFNNTTLNASAASSSLIYQRDVSMPLNGTRADARDLGALITDKTQLDITGQVSRENATHYYKFTLDGDNLKLNFQNNTSSSALRLQILNKNGTVVADSSSFASAAKREAYQAITSGDGLDQDAGEYYVKVTFDSTAMRSVPQTYSVALYSGTRFSVSYQTTGKSQTKSSQAVLIDNTMTYSLIDAKGFETKNSHIANAQPADAINIGWIFENKSALSVSSQLTDVCSCQYYMLTLQKGESLKMAFNNKTNTSEMRIQVYDPLGVKLYADSHGTTAQREAYEALQSADGLAVDTGNYLFKVSYAPDQDKKKQIYELKFYSGNTFDTLYETKVGTESLSAAIANGRWATQYNMQNATVAYLQNMADGNEVNIMDAVSMKF